MTLKHFKNAEFRGSAELLHVWIKHLKCWYMTITTENNAKIMQK